jgi:hypothetical protein
MMVFALNKRRNYADPKKVISTGEKDSNNEVSFTQEK